MPRVDEFAIGIGLEQKSILSTVTLLTTQTCSHLVRSAVDERSEFG